MWLWRDPALRPSLPIDADGRLIPVPVPPSPPVPPLPPVPPPEAEPPPPPLLLAAAADVPPVNCADNPTQPGCGQVSRAAVPAVDEMVTATSKVRCWSSRRSHAVPAVAACTNRAASHEHASNHQQPSL